MGVIDAFKSKIINFFNQKFTKRKYFLGDPNLLDEPYAISHIAVTPKIDDYLTKAAFAEMQVLLSTLETNLQGLDEEGVNERQALYGLNEIQPETKMTWSKRLWICYRNPFSLLLSVLAIVSFVTADVIGSITICLMIAIATILRFIQESRSDEAVSKLKKMVHVTATVLRQPTQEQASTASASFQKGTEIPIAQLVPGDIIFLSAGGMIPADVCLLSDKDLFVSEATLTGESVPMCCCGIIMVPII